MGGPAPLAGAAAIAGSGYKRGAQAGSEERRVGEEGRSRGGPYHLKKKKSHECTVVRYIITFIEKYIVVNTYVRQTGKVDLGFVVRSITSRRRYTSNTCETPTTLYSVE